MKYFSLVVIFWVGISSASDAHTVEFDRLEQNTLFFKSADPVPPLKTGLYHTEYLGTLRPADGGLPYFLIAGKSCDDCSEDPFLYTFRPNGVRPDAFVFPGTIKDPKTKSVLFESQAFFGRCLPQQGDVYVVFQREKLDRKSQLQASVLTFIPRKNLPFIKLEGDQGKRKSLPSLRRTNQFVRQGVCHRIAGKSRFMSAKPYNLRARPDAADEEENSDQET